MRGNRAKVRQSPVAELGEAAHARYTDPMKEAKSAPLRVAGFVSCSVLLATGLLVAQRSFGDPRAIAATGSLFDDAFFYMVMADAVVMRSELAFHPGMLTNGVQPLWMGLLVAARSILPGVDMDRISLFLGAFAFLLGTVAWLRLLLHRIPAGTILGFFALTTLSAPFQAWVLQGLETPLLWLLIPVHAIVLLGALDRSGDQLASGVLIGLTSGLVFLARTDCFVFGIVAMALVAVQRSWRTLAGAGAAMSLVVLPYLVANVVWFDALVPLSGRAKQFYLELWYPSLSAYLASDEWWGLATAFLKNMAWYPLEIRSAPTALAVILTGLVVIGATVSQRDSVIEQPSGRRLLVWLALSAGLHALVMYGYHREVRPYTSYYFLPETLLLALSLVSMLNLLVVRFTRRPVVVWGALALGSCAMTASSVPTPHPAWVDRLRMAEHLRTSIPTNATVGAYWPGALAYYGTLPVVPLDGIIASRDYQDEVMANQRQLRELCQRPRPHLVVNLGKPVPEFLADPPSTKPWSWSRAGLLQMVQFGLDRLEPRAAFGNWALFELKCGRTESAAVSRSN